MGSLEQRLNNPSYKFWIKAGLCLINVKEGIEKFADERSVKVHGFVKAAVSTDKICKKEPYLKQKWTFGCCKKCDAYIKGIIQYKKKEFTFNQLNWSNSDARYWPNKPWEMVKVYMNIGQKDFATQPSAKETDLSGLLNFIDHCLVPRVDVQDKDNIKKVKNARNAIMHSASMQMSYTEFSTCTADMKNLLKDPLCLDKIPEAKDAVKAIQRIQTEDFIILINQEIEVLSEKTTFIQEQNDALRKDVKGLKDKYTEMENLINAKDESFKDLLQKERSEREDALKMLKEEINEKEGHIKKLETDLLLLKKLIHKDEALHREMDIRVSKIETTLNKTITEFEQIKKSQEMLMKHVDQTPRFKQEITSPTVEKLQKLTDENKTLKENFEKIKIRCVELENLLSTKTSPQLNITQEKELKELTEINQNLKEQVHRLQNELSDTKSKERESEDKCTKKTCMERLEALEFANKTLKSENEMLRPDYNAENLYLKKLNVYAEETNVLKRQREELKNSLNAEENRSNLLDKQLSEQQTLSSKNERVIEKLNQEAISLRNQRDSLAAEKENNELELTKNKAEIQKLSSKIQTLEYNFKISKEHCDKTNAKIETLNTEKKNLEDDLLQKDKINQQLNAEITRLKTSEGRKTTARQETDVIIATQVKIRDEDDNVKPWISGAEFLAEGYLAICDGRNMKIKVFTGSFGKGSSLSLETQPWDVAELERNSLAVTLPYTKQLLYVQVQPTLQKKRTLELNKMCWGITVFGNELYVTHLNKLGEGGVIVLDTEGPEIKSISAHSDFVNPENLAVNEDGLTYVSDNDSNLITVIDSKGSKIQKYHEPDLEKPGGICFDIRGNVIICGSGSNNLHIVSADGKRLKTIQTPKNPLCVAYRKDDVLVIGFDDDGLLVMQLDKLLAEKNEHE